MFCDRDHRIVYTLAELERERRDGYGWYTYAMQKEVKACPAWHEKNAPVKNVLDNQQYSLH